MLTHLSLFSGIGGLDLAAEMAGIKTVGQCEWADFQTKILEKHWPSVPRWRDIRTLTGDSFYERTGLRTVDIISGGFPCQPFSQAGKHKGVGDDRYLWPEMLRVIRELRPTWVIGENVPGIINLALDEVLSDLDNEGYTAQPFIVPACGVDAPHRRERVVILAYANGKQLGRVWAQSNPKKDAGKGLDHGRRTDEPSVGKLGKDRPEADRVADGIHEGIHSTASDADSDGLQGRMSKTVCGGWQIRQPSPQSHRIHSPWENWLPESGVGRVVDGVPDRVDRIRALGNAVVPQQFYIFFKLIADIEGDD